VKVVWIMLQQKKNDYFIAKNKSYWVKDFIKESCKYLNFKIKCAKKNWNEKTTNINNNEVLLQVVKFFLTPAKVYNLKNSFIKAKKYLKWKYETSFKQLIKIMIDSKIIPISSRKFWNK
jgi:GDP-D-mannose dehydratase